MFSNEPKATALWTSSAVPGVPMNARIAASVGSGRARRSS
jgi:hypothetical protein